MPHARRHGPNDEGLSRRHILKAVVDSLTRLGTDYIDLYQPHYPDPDTPLDETLRALDDLVRQGKVRYVGCSNYPAWQVALSLGLSCRHDLARFDCVQPPTICFTATSRRNCCRSAAIRASASSPITHWRRFPERQVPVP